MTVAAMDDKQQRGGQGTTLGGRRRRNTPFGCSDGNVHALTKVKACSPTSSYIITVNVMTIFHGFVCRRMASTMKHKGRRMRHMMCFFYVYVSAMMYCLLSCCPIKIAAVEGGNWVLSSLSSVVVSSTCLLICPRCNHCSRLHHCCCCCCR